MKNTNIISSLTIAGLIAVAIHAILLFISLANDTADFDLFGIDFGIVYFTILAFGVGMMFNRYYTKNRTREERLRNLSILGILMLISCFKLNRQIPVISTPADWLIFYLTLYSTILLISQLPYRMPAALSYLSHLILWLSLPILFYLAILLLPIYHIGLIGFIVVGIGLHTFVPLFLIIVTLTALLREKNEGKHSVPSSPIKWASLGLLMIYPCIYIYQSASLARTIDEAVSQSQAQQDTKPKWYAVAQNIPINTTTLEVLSQGIKYDQHNNSDGLFWLDFNRSMGDEKTVHDPLAYIASIFTPNAPSERYYSTQRLSRADKARIRKLAFDKNNFNNERLWTGQDLTLSDVQTSIELRPEHRLAYTEKTILIRNHHLDPNNQQEALFTFFLSPDAVVSSLSLWIDGVEEKARLTTKEKANTAYNTIVGRERRDPSVLFWKEGNKITAKVFPCTPRKDRKFKIGVTNPLKSSENKLTYQNLRFEGPAYEPFTEQIQLNASAQTLSKLEHDFSVIDRGDNYIKCSRTYSPSFAFHINGNKLDMTPFIFQSKAYKMSKLPTYTKAYSPKNVVLDINTTWTKKEYNQLLKALPNTTNWVYNKQWTHITEDNKDELYSELQRYNFNLLPINELSHTENLLILTKPSNISLQIEDFDTEKNQNSAFYEKVQSLKDILKTATHVHVLAWENQNENYFKTYSKIGKVNYFDLKWEEVIKHTTDRTMPYYQIDATQKIIPYSDVCITQTAVTKEPFNSNDHIKRLYDYNAVLDLWKNDKLDQANELAKSSNIVTPTSSLIVLETIKDYERFDIEKSKNTLGNAVQKSDGAVPEPHEWALIITSILTLFIFRKRLLA